MRTTREKYRHAILIHGAYVVMIVAIILTVFSGYYKAALADDMPLSYDGDSLVVLASIRAAEEGGMLPFLPVRIQRLNAPSEAWWSDAPISELVYWLPTLLTGFLGFFPGSSWFVALMLCAAGIGFYFSAVGMGGSRIPSATMGVLFALMPYAFVRNIEHLTLTLYFVVPLFIYSAWSVFGERGVNCSNWRIALLCFLAVVASMFNPYYWAMFLILVAFAGVGHMANFSLRGTIACLLLGFSGCFGFLLQNLDTFYFRWTEGANNAVISRDLWWMVKFGLYLPDMLLPATHRLAWLEHLSGSNYQWKIPVPIQGESQTAYIGLVAALFLITLIIGGFIGASAGRRKPSPPLFWFALVVFGFAVAGGLNYLVGAFGFQMLRATNRYSIFLAALGLFYGVLLISRVRKTPLMGAVCAIILPFGIYDQIPKIPEWLRSQRAGATDRFRMDREFFPRMEALLPPGSEVFQLPRMPFPENGPILNMGDYEHFRPYLHTKNLKLSYGTVKGRQHAFWQEGLDNKPVAEVLGELKKRNFDAILINRRAYPDAGEGISASFVSAGCPELMRNSDFIVLKCSHD